MDMQNFQKLDKFLRKAASDPGAGTGFFSGGDIFQVILT